MRIVTFVFLAALCASVAANHMCDSKTGMNVVQHGVHARQVKLCADTIERSKEKLDTVHSVTEVLDSINGAAGNVNDAVGNLDKIWNVVKPAVKAIPKVGTVIEAIVTMTLKNADTISDSVDKLTKVFPKIHGKVEVAVKAAEHAVEGSKAWSDAAAEVQATLNAASKCNAACASGLVRDAAALAVGFYDSPVVKGGLDTCTGELKDFNDSVDNFYAKIKAPQELTGALHDFQVFIEQVTDELNAFKKIVGTEVEQALCCTGLVHPIQAVKNVIDVVTCPIDGALAAKAELVNQLVVNALRPLLAAFMEHVDFPTFPGLNIEAAERVLYELPAAARGCGLPERLALQASAVIPALDLRAAIRGGGKFDLVHIAANVGVALTKPCEDAIANIGNVGCYCPLVADSYGRGVGEPVVTKRQVRTCPRGQTSKFVAFDDGKVSGRAGPGMRCGKKVRKLVKPSHWPSTADKCIPGYQKKYSFADVADRCWKTTCRTVTRTCNVGESCCRFNFWQWRCTGKKKARKCTTAGPFNDKWAKRYTNDWQVASVGDCPKGWGFDPFSAPKHCFKRTCKPGWEYDGDGGALTLLCYPKCKPGYTGIGPVCWLPGEDMEAIARGGLQIGRQLEQQRGTDAANGAASDVWEESSGNLRGARM